MKRTKSVKDKQQKGNVSFLSTDNEMFKLIILILIIAVVFVIFYIITSLVTKKDGNLENQENVYEATIQYDKILVSNILNQSPHEYYVLVYFEDDMYFDLYNTYLSIYATTVEGAVPYYLVDMSEVFNEYFIADDSNLKVTDSKDFKFKDTTLIRVIDGKVVSTYETREDITSKFGRMTK